MRLTASLLVVVAAAAAGAGCAPRTYPTYSQPSQPAKPVEDSTETRPHIRFIVAGVTPTMDVAPAGAITVSRTLTVKSTFLVTSWHTSRTSAFRGNGTVVALHKDTQFGFGVTPLDISGVDRTDGQGVGSSMLALSILIRNSSSSGIHVDWNSVTIIGGSSRAYPVIHRGVKMADRSGVMAPSTIPPGAILDDFVYPRELLSFTSGRYGGWRGQQYFEALRPGDRFTLYLPVKRGQESTEYQFIFEAAEPTSAATQ